MKIKAETQSALKDFAVRFARFLAAGGVSTLFSLLAYLLFLFWFSSTVSYTLSYAVGIVFSYSLQRFFVFKKTGGAKSLFLFPCMTALQYFMGLAIVWLWTDVMGWDKHFATIPAILLSIPVTYFLSSRIFSGCKTKA